MNYTSLQNLSGILPSLDFRKAFDSIERSSIMKTLDHLNFGRGIKRWVNTFYTNIESAVQNNGFIVQDIQVIMPRVNNLRTVSTCHERQWHFLGDIWVNLYRSLASRANALSCVDCFRPRPQSSLTATKR